MRAQKRNRANALKDEDINKRAIEAVDARGLMNPMRQATLELALSHDYDEAARKAGVTPETVLAWTKDPNFVAAIGWIVVGLADNHE